MNNETQDQFGLMSGTGFNIGNFDPADIQEEEVILLGIAMDVSPSISGYQKDLNVAFGELISSLQGSHVAPKIMVKIIEFCEDITDLTGYMPIASVDPSKLKFVPKGAGTALFAAAKHIIQSTVDYRKQLEATGVNVKTLVFTVTDGDNNCAGSAVDVADILAAINKEERNIFSFETILFGVGSSRTSFENAQKQMGFKHLAVVGQTGDEIKKMIGFISASVSKSNSNQTISF